MASTVLINFVFGALPYKEAIVIIQVPDKLPPVHMDNSYTSVGNFFFEDKADLLFGRFNCDFTSKISLNASIIFIFSSSIVFPSLITSGRLISCPVYVPVTLSFVIFTFKFMITPFL
jgi:hypothetical protein